MSTTISIAFDDASRELIARMKSAPADMLAAIARGMDKGLALALGQITRDRFTGKGPFDPSLHKLGVGQGKTGNRLRSSLRWNVTGLPGQPGGQPSQVAGNTISGSVGSNVAYAGVHEYGFSGTVNVRAFTRHVSPSQFGTAIPKDARKNKTTQQAALGMEQVREHRRVLNIPARAPLGTGLRENSSTITAQIGLALQTAWQKRGAQ